jgi:alpha-1,3-mannosyltransferase
VLSVLHVCTDFWPSTGGIQQFVYNLAERSASLGVRVTVLCFNRIKGFSGTLRGNESIGPIAVKRVPFIDLVFYKPTAIPMSALRSHDVIHVHGIGAPLDYIALMKWVHKRPIVVSTHGGIFHTPAAAGLKHLYFYHVLPFIMRQVDVVAACSRSDAALFRAVSDRVVLLENAVAIQPYLALTGSSRQRGRCLYVGRFSDNKGIDLLLRAAAVARSQGAQFSLRLVGPDVEGKRGRYEAFATSLGLAECVTFVGGLSHELLLQEYDLAETFVSASKYEGFGLAAIEAKAAGCRLLLQDNEAFRSLFESDAAATLVNFGDSDLAGTVFSRLLNSEPYTALEEGRRLTEAYSWDRKILEWSALYCGLAGCSAQVPDSCSIKSTRPKQ